MGTGAFGEFVEETVVLTNAELDAQVRALELQCRETQAKLAATIAVAEQRRLYADDGHVTINAYLRATCSWSKGEASGWRSISNVVHWIPEIGDAWWNGRIGRAQVAQFGTAFGNRRACGRLPEFVPVLLEKAEQLPFSGFDLCMKQFLSGADPDGAHQDRDRAVEHRDAHVVVNGTELDVAAVGGDPITATEVVATFRAFEEAEFDADVAARAALHGSEADAHPYPRTAAQRRFDAFVAMTRAAAQSGAGSGTALTKVVNVVIDQSTFRELLANADLVPSRSDVMSDLADCMIDPDEFANRRCETSDGVPIHPHDVLRALLDGLIRRVVVNSDGVVTDMGRKARLFTGPAREAAMLLVNRCQHPGCDLPADFCQVDHNLEWADGGSTDQANSNIVCGRHNRWKHRQRWRTQRATNGQYYTIRADGTIVLPVGAGQPEFEDPVEIRRMVHLARERAAALARAG